MQIFFFEADIIEGGKIYGTVNATYPEEAETHIRIHYVNGECLNIGKITIKEVTQDNFSMYYLGN